ncbi:TOBE domain-containing protein [Microbacterium sp. CnD16-F]|uniref:TOBE domain-containing protein n=1 Tax=Microbacterium gawkjiense TaxID=3067309 RepID=A0ABU3G6A9_9MICO|nr:MULTISPECIES: TOBE domain-containing protein [unclassified Microbacterium]MCO7203961.1 TOBE domain-containing protein [Microbacterium sp. CnD16-F]MDT0181143.1 TOBE domain-containing protein [Microbacterium sp. ARD31]MDT3315344.1 TOBE domain-containing protein [Microbacterium sp. KSW4-11]
MTTYRVARAARLLGVSDDSVRRWIDQGLLPVTDAVPAEIPGEALAAFAVTMANDPGDGFEHRSSARNSFVGIVTRVQVDGVMAQVDIQAGPHRVVSLLSAEAVRELQLEVGTTARASVKATNVVVELAGD